MIGAAEAAVLDRVEAAWIAAGEPTPALVFDLETILNNARLLRDIGATQGADFLLAAKSCFDERIMEALAPEVAGFDVSNQVELASVSRWSAGRIVSLTGPIALPLLREARPDVLLQLDGPEQYQRMERTCTGARYGLRLDTSWLMPDHPPSRFGFAHDRPEGLQQYVRSSLNHFCGFHFHHEGPIGNSTDTYLALVRRALELQGSLGMSIERLDLGGGLHWLSWREIALLLGRLRALVPRSTGLTFEPGRLFFRDAGFAVGRIMWQKQVHRQLHYVVDLSRECHLRWSRTRLLIAPPGPAGVDRLVLSGPTCIEGDSIPVATPPAGDLVPRAFGGGGVVVLGDVPSYSATLNRGFNGVPPASILVAPAMPRGRSTSGIHPCR
jgi:diaminopimelate decarboxylase